MRYGSSATSPSIVWRRLDQPGHDSAQLIGEAAGAVLEGMAVFSESGRSCQLGYRILCDRSWRSVSARISGWMDTTAVEIEIATDAMRSWILNGRECPGVRGCDDLDLSFSPATNLLPIRRLKLAVGTRAAARAAWLRFPDLTLEPLDQTYHRIGDSRYSYESGGGAFATVLETNADGFVTHYPGLWQAE